MTSKRDKRQFIRIPLLHELADVVVDGVSFQLRMTDICQGGAFFEVDGKAPRPQQNTAVRLALPGDLPPLYMQAKIVRVRWREDQKKKIKRGFAVQFLDDDPNKRKILDAFVVYLRNKQIISVSKRIIEEFFGPKGRI